MLSLLWPQAPTVGITFASMHFASRIASSADCLFIPARLGERWEIAKLNLVLSCPLLSSHVFLSFLPVLEISGGWFSVAVATTTDAAAPIAAAGANRWWANDSWDLKHIRSLWYVIMMVLDCRLYLRQTKIRFVTYSRVCRENSRNSTFFFQAGILRYFQISTIPIAHTTTVHIYIYTVIALSCEPSCLSYQISLLLKWFKGWTSVRTRAIWSEMNELQVSGVHTSSLYNRSLPSKRILLTQL